MSGMDFKAASGKVRKLLAPAKRPKDLSRSVLTEDTLRDNIVADAAKTSDRFKKASKKSPKVTYKETVEQEDGSTQEIEREFEWEQFPEMMRDYARAAFEWSEPEVRPLDEIQRSHWLNREVMQSMMATPEWAESRPYTRNNEMESLYGAMAAADSLQESAGGLLAEHIARSQQISEAEQEQQTAEQMFENLRKQAKHDVEQDGTVAGPTRRQIKQALKQIQSAQQNVAGLLQQQAQSGMVNAAIQAGQQAAAAAQEAVDAIAQIPGMDEGMKQRLNADQQIALAEKWAKNPDLKRIAKLLGRMLRSFRFKRSARSRNVNIEPVGVTTGNDLRLLLPHELARAYSDNRLVKTTFMKDYSERALLQYDMEGKQPSGKGPIICAWDGSGSMQGEPFVWASSVALTLLMTALREKRPFLGIEFGASTREMASWYFPKGEDPDPDRVLEMTGHFFGGGTDTTVGMNEALRCLRDEPAFKTADVILIGDGQDYFREDDKAARDAIHALGARIHGITIMTGANPYFDQMCDWHADVVDLANNDVMDKLAESIT